MVAWTPSSATPCRASRRRRGENGYEETRPVDLEELYAREPNLGPGAEGAIEIPGEGIVCPFTTTLAFATEAVGAGCELVAQRGGHRRAAERRRPRARDGREGRSARSTW